jgi:2-polyprenyl-3-methyl-5-hydroxy-6-metoxy-1,4-benzoquinol methylase
MANRAGGASCAPIVLDSVPCELHGHRKKLRFIWSRIERYRAEKALPPAEVRVLEVGCSNGRNISIPLAGCGYRVTGIDLHAESIEYARQRCSAPNARFLSKQLEELDEQDVFEIIVLSDILEHVEDPAGVCVTALRHLARDGRILISVPNGFGPYELEQRFLRRTRLDAAVRIARAAINRMLRRDTAGPAYNADSGHIQFFHLAEFRRLLDTVGLEILDHANGALLGGTLSYALMNRIPAVVSGSLELADRLPTRWVSTWYFCCAARSR